METSFNATKAQKRVAYLDVVRIIATIGVIAQHVYGIDMESNIGSCAWRNAVVGEGLLGSWAVPLFVMISGCLFLNPQKEISFRQLFKKYIPRLLGAFVFWWFMYSCITIGQSLTTGGGINIRMIQPHFHLWFLLMLMGVYLLIPFLKRIVCDESLAKWALIIWAIYCSGCFFKVNQLPIFGLFFEMNIVIGYAGFFILGHYVNNHDVSKKQAAWIYIIGIMGALACIIGTFLISIKSGVSSTMFLGKLGLPVIAMSLAIFTFAKQKISVIQGRINTLIDILAKNLFGVYLTHAIWLTVLCDNMYVWNLMDHRLLLPIIILCIFILSLVITILLRQVPFLRKVVE